MKTRLIYNYKQGDSDLAGRIDALSLRLNLGEGETLEGKISASVTSAVGTERAEREDAIERMQTKLETMQTEIDGAISTHFIPEVPTLENEPVSEWTEDEYDTHLGDLCYNTETGFCYRWQKEDDEYSWALVKDTDVTKALADAAEAKAGVNASVKTAQGAANAGHHLVVDAQGNVSAAVPGALMLSSPDGMKMYVITVEEGGALAVSEVVADGGE